MLMSTYLIEPDFDYLELDLDPLDLETQFPESFELEKILNFSRHNIPLKKLWPQIEAGFVDTGELRKTPDISIWIDGALLLSSNSMRLLSELLEPYGEILSIKVNNEEWYIFNCLNLSTGGCFEGRFDEVIYKLSVSNRFGIFCKSEFKNRVEENGLRGVIFSKAIDSTAENVLH